MYHILAKYDNDFIKLGEMVGKSVAKSSV